MRVQAVDARGAARRRADEPIEGGAKAAAGFEAVIELQVEHGFSLAHAGQSLSPAELAALQKRIDDAGLLFKVRVVSAQTKGTDSL